MGKRMDEVDGKLETMDRRVDAVDGKLETMGKRMDAVDGKMIVMDNKLNTMDNRMVVIEKRVEAIFDQTLILTEFKMQTEAALAEINKTIESKYDLILRDIELIAGEQGKQRIDIERLKDATGVRR